MKLPIFGRKTLATSADVAAAIAKHDEALTASRVALDALIAKGVALLAAVEAEAENGADFAQMVEIAAATWDELLKLFEARFGWACVLANLNHGGA